MTKKNWRYGDINDYGWDRKANEYEEVFCCINCKKEICIFIKKGTRRESVKVSVECPNCGIVQNEKKWE